ncbi:unnamed protein product [Prunus armeniaca]|uniref:SnoaL-like domain-containing protein n=1 Tax=Prunus armeniaca TaxID=36596 RepID=A0A6J5Y2L2_PRUAR|nr:unnamed protein product [Prunus armeniaca]
MPNNNFSLSLTNFPNYGLSDPIFSRSLPHPKQELQPQHIVFCFSTSTQCNKSYQKPEDPIVINDDGSCGIAPLPLPPSVLEAVQDFYKAINAKDIQALEQLLADDCHYQDLVFYVPFVGKEAIVHFLSKVMDAMGFNIHFVIDAATEGGNLTASVIWHLEWKDKEIPFATGCTFFEYEQVEGELFLRKATGMEELPFKPGDLVLKLLKSASTFFDLYPMAAEALLLKSHGSGPHEGLDTLLDKLRGRH